MKKFMTKKEAQMQIAEVIGEIKGKTLTLNGKPNQIILDADSLIQTLRAISDLLNTP